MRKTKLITLILCVFFFAHIANAQQYVGLNIRMQKIGKIILEQLPRTTTVLDFYKTASSRWKITEIRMK